MARRVGNEFPGFFKLASHIDPISWNESENIIPIEKPEKERKIGKSISFIILDQRSADEDTGSPETRISSLPGLSGQNQDRKNSGLNRDRVNSDT